MNTSYPTSTTMMLIFFLVQLCLSLHAVSASIEGKPFRTVSFLRTVSPNEASSRHRITQTTSTRNDASFLRDVRHCSTDEPSDCEARFAVQYGHELTTIRAMEHAYLFHDDEFPIVPASNKRIVPRNHHGRPLQSDLVIV